MAIEIIRTDSLQLLFIGGVATASSTPASRFIGKRIPGAERNIYLLSNHLVDAISSKFIRAMLCHEEGHIFYNHHDRYKNNYNKSVNGINIFDSKIAELQADKYAANRATPQVMIKALKAIITYMATSKPIIAKLSVTMPLEAAQAQANIYSKNLEEVLTYRIAALEKMI